MPFSKKENLCTIFATEIIMRRDASSLISCKISPGNEHLEEEQGKPREFKKTISELKKVPLFIREATVLMFIILIGSGCSEYQNLWS